jgi:hypothetical protein
VTKSQQWKLKGEAQQTFKEKMISEGPWDEEGSVDNMRVKMATSIQKVA